MNLSKRALLLITPVILASFALASAMVYDQSRSFVLRQEQERLDFAVIQLSATYQRYINFANSYMMSLRDDHAFQQFLQDPQNPQIIAALSPSLNRNLDSFSLFKGDVLAVTLTANTDPEQTIAQYSSGQIPQHLASSLAQARQSNSGQHWSYINSDGERSTIINTRFIEAQNQSLGSISVQLAIEPSMFRSLCAQYKQEFNASFSIEDASPSIENLKAFAELGNGEFLVGMLSDDHLQQQLLPLIHRMVLISVLFFIFASASLYWLLRRYITMPVAMLEQDLADIVSRRDSELPIRQGNDEIGRLSRTFSKLYSDLSQSYRDSRAMMLHDPLTGLCNLGHITDSVIMAVKGAKDSHNEVALMYLDLDNFKYINDKFGHRFGNSLLCSFSQSLKSLAANAQDQSNHEQPPQVTVGRVGGDQFCILIQHPIAFVIAREIAGDVLALMADGILFEENRFPVTVSIGIAAFPNDSNTPSQLISNADTAMHQAKIQGKSQIAVYSEELASATNRRQDIESELKTMEPDNEFKLVYMPLVNVRSNTLDGFEALLRWDSPKLGSVDPEEFVPIAESCGVFAKLDEWVIRTGLSTYPKLRKQLGRDFKLSLNISSAQLLMSNLIEVLDHYVKQYDIPPQFIQLEITETVNIEYTTYAGSFLNSLASRGFSLALDDFGAGFTSLMRIVEYPINMVKFDKQFIQRTLEKDNRRVLKPLVELCHSNGMLVTMEGAESQEDIDLLRSFDCDYVQGYVLGMPLELENMAETLAQYESAALAIENNSSAED
ncbi:MAG: EAL domain-containing protein [Pseudohongiellaceae bacterium]|nr:EAL domain-containing protein [Pseudohongiellaceae bacterium]